MGKDGQNTVTLIAIGYDYLTPKGKSNGGLLKRWLGDTTCKSARLTTYKAGTKDTLSAVAAYTPGTSNKTAWWVTNGVDLPGNTLVREMLGSPIDAFKFSSPIEITNNDFYVAPEKGATPGLCVIITIGANLPLAERGMLAWGTPGEGSFTGVGNPVAVAFGADVHVTELKLTGHTPYVSFLTN